MRPAPQFTPAQLVALAITGALLAATGFTLTTSNLFHSGGWLLRLAALAVPLGFGFALAIWAAGKLRDGIALERWPAAATDRLRKSLRRPILIVSVAAFIGFACSIFLSHRYRGLGWSCFVLQQCLLQLQMALKDPTTPDSPPSAKWQDLKPLQSQNWGRP